MRTLLVASTLLTLTFALTVAATSGQAQSATAPARAPAPVSGPVLVTVPAAAPADVASIDAIVTALYDVISGPAGQPRDWARLRSLFIPHGRLMPTRPPQPEAPGAMRVWEVNDYIAQSGPQLEHAGFRERELARRVEQYGHIAHVFSTYEGRNAGDSTAMRGINSIQLMHDGTRWWVVSLFWAGERGGTPLPAKYLRNEP